jgi:hypothetical protein
MAERIVCICPECAGWRDENERLREAIRLALDRLEYVNTDEEVTEILAAALRTTERIDP